MDDPIVFPKQHEEINVVARPEENINHDKDCTVGWNQFWKIILLVLRFLSKTEILMNFSLFVSILSEQILAQPCKNVGIW